MHALLLKFFPEDDVFPSPGDGLSYYETEMFDKICMPLVHILDFFSTKLHLKCIANVEFHDGA